MPNYTATNLDGEYKSSGNRKIKATQVSLNGIKASAVKLSNANATSNDAKDTKTIIDRLNDKGVTTYKLEENGNANFVGRKAINVSSGMFSNITENKNFANTSTAPTSKFEIPAEKEEEKEASATADGIINALQIFENTHDLADKDEQKEAEKTPAYMQVSGKIEEEPSFEKEQTQDIEIPQVKEETPVEQPTHDFPMEEQHQSSGYLDAMKQFQNSIGAPEYEERNTPSRDFQVHTNEQPMEARMPEGNYNYGTANEYNSMNMAHANPSYEENRNMNMGTMEDEEIQDFISGYSNLDDLPLSQIKKYRTGCVGYVAKAEEKMSEASNNINGIYGQIKNRNSQIDDLKEQIRILENENAQDKQGINEWQDVYSKANTEKSLADSKVEQIDGFIYNAFNAFGQSAAPSYNESAGYGRGRAA